MNGRWGPSFGNMGGSGNTAHDELSRPILRCNAETLELSGACPAAAMSQ